MCGVPVAPVSWPVVEDNGLLGCKVTLPGGAGPPFAPLLFPESEGCLSYPQGALRDGMDPAVARPSLFYVLCPTNLASPEDSALDPSAGQSSLGGLGSLGSPDGRGVLGAVSALGNLATRANLGNSNETGGPKPRRPGKPPPAAASSDRPAPAKPRKPAHQPQPAQRFWSHDEHLSLMRAVKECGEENVRQLAERVQTRTIAQIRTHLQKYNLKVANAVSKGYEASDLACKLLYECSTPLLRLFAVGEGPSSFPGSTGVSLRAERAQELVKSRPGLVGLCTLIALCSSLAKSELGPGSCTRALGQLGGLLAKPRANTAWKGERSPLSEEISRAMGDLRAQVQRVAVGGGKADARDCYAVFANFMGMPLPEGEFPLVGDDTESSGPAAQRQAKKRLRAKAARQSLSYVDVEDFWPLATASWGAQDVLEADAFLHTQLGEAWPREHVQRCISGPRDQDVERRAGEAKAESEGEDTSADEFCVTMVSRLAPGQACEPAGSPAAPSTASSSVPPAGGVPGGPERDPWAVDDSEAPPATQSWEARGESLPAPVPTPSAGPTQKPDSPTPPTMARAGATFLEPSPVALAAETLILSLMSEGRGRIALLAQVAMLAGAVSRATGDPPWVVIHHVTSELGDDQNVVAGLVFAVSALAAQARGLVTVFGKA